jgi:hypothetical protein
MGGDLDFNKDFQVPFGAYVQANQENNPTTITPAYSWLYLFAPLWTELRVATRWWI